MTKTNFRESQLFFLFERDVEIRKKVFIFEEILEKEFIAPFTVNNVSDQENADIIRLQTKSLNRFSNLSITQNKILLRTSYSEDFQNDSQKIKSYLDQKSEIFREVLKNQKLHFFGIIANIDIELPENGILDFFKNKTGINVINQDTLDFNYFYSQKYKQTFYINANVGRFNYIKGELLQDKRTGETKEELIETVTGVVTNIDFNNKPEFLNKKAITFDDSKRFLNEFFSMLTNNEFENFVTANIKG